MEDSFRNPNVVAMATIDRDVWLLFLNLPDFSTRFLLGGLLFLKGNRVTLEFQLTKLKENLCINFGGICNFRFRRVLHLCMCKI